MPPPQAKIRSVDPSARNVSGAWRADWPEENTGITLTESFAMLPAAAVSGFYFSHPESRYFAVGKIDRDQVEDYHRRKGMDLRAMERWLSPNLNYDPET